MTHHTLSRRALLLQCACTTLSCALAAPGRRPTMLDLIAAPSNLGLRPPPHGGEPGAWRAPTALGDAGLSRRVRPQRRLQLPRPVYADLAPPGSRVRNGPALRDFSLRLSAEVEASLRSGATPLVVGGDCSVLLGCLHGLRRAGGRARTWLHVDLDVVDGTELPAVDSPGSPCLAFHELGALLRGPVGTGRVAGLDVAIYDPDLDPQGRYAPRIVDRVASVADCIRRGAR